MPDAPRISDAPLVGNEGRVLVLAPTPRDAALCADLLTHHQIESISCADLGELCVQVMRGAGAVVVCVDLIGGDGLDALAAALAAQPGWSDLPVLLLAGGSADSPAVSAALGRLSNVLLLSRPVHLTAFVSAIRMALRGRTRQYELRDQMQALVSGAAALRESEERFRTMADTIPQLACIARVDGYILWYNRRWYEYTGMTPQQMEGWGWQSVHDPKLLPSVLKKWQASIATGQPFEMEFPLCGADGAFRQFLTRARPVKDVEGRVVQWFGTSTDVDELRRATEAQALLAAVVESSDDAIASKKLDGTILSWNAGAQRLFGYSAKEIIGQPITRLMPPELAHEEELILAELRQGKRCERSETIRVAKDGRPIDVSMTVSPLRDRDGRMFGASTIIHDITERKRLEQQRQELLDSERDARNQAERAVRAKDEFLATLSHELRTPLGAILGWAQLLRRGRLPPEDARDAVKVIEESAQLQRQLIEDLLDMSRIVAGKLKLDARPLDIAVVSQAAVAMFQADAKAKGVHLEAQLDVAAGQVLGDVGRLKQVIGNLLSNAVKFTPAGGRVRVSLRRAGQHAEIAVSDTGIGVAPELLPQLFERFRQADGSSTRHYGGLGLGLALVRQLTEMHGGTVRGRSRGAGRGTTFMVRLPLLAAPHVAAGADEHGAQVVLDANLADVAVLLVEDESTTRTLIARILREAGATVTACGSAAEALRAIQTRSYGMLISDISMPGEDGYSLLRKVRRLPDAERASTPAIALTAFSGEGNRSSAFAAGFQTHMTKPVEATELCAAVANLARRNGPGSREPEEVVVAADCLRPR